MNRFASGAAIAALTLLASVPALPATAQTAQVTLSVTNPDPLPGQRIDVTGDGPDCPADALANPGTFALTLSYTTPAARTATVVVSGAIAANGTFSAAVTLPDTAVSDKPASLISTSTCSGTATDSNRITLAVLYHSGVGTLSAKTVAAGGSITVTGATCYGGEYVVLYGPASADPNKFKNGTSGVPAADRSFTATLTIPPDLAAGSYDVYTLCPGTEYLQQALTVTAGPPTSGAKPAPAASTVVVASPGAVPAEPSLTAATLGGGFTGAEAVAGKTTTTTGGGAVATPVATAPVAVAGVAAFTG